MGTWFKDDHTISVLLDQDTIMLKVNCAHLSSVLPADMPEDEIPECRRYYDENGRPVAEGPLSFCNFNEFLTNQGDIAEFADTDVMKMQPGPFAFREQYTPIAIRWDSLDECYVWAPVECLDAYLAAQT